jgi:DNA polymerase
MARELHIDIETFSSVDIKTSGAYKYTQSLDFEILLIAYAFDDEPIKIIDLAQGEQIPQELIDGLLDTEVHKWAHNATFERNSFRQYGYDIPIDQWYCSAVKAAYCGLPLSLDLVSKALKLEEKGKLSTGKALIRYFCIPCKPTKANGMRMRNFPQDDLEKWEDFKLYCINDVEAEREIGKRLEQYEMPDFERINYIVDQEINDAGVLVDLGMVQNAVDIDNKFSDETTERMKILTGVENPNSPSQLKEWLSSALGKTVSTLAKDSVLELLSESDDEAVSDVLDGRLKMSKSSTKKYVSMLNCTCGDGRAHGLFQFYGANRTGRWAGRLIQLQNLPQNHMKDLDLAREVIASGDYDLAMMLYDNIPNILSELIRTALIAPEGYTFAVSDFSAIEARVLSWVAQEEWRLEVFRTHGKIYEASAAMMFGVPIESVTKGSELRQRGKTAELALGYQGSEGAMEKMDREGKIPPNERKVVVNKWRKANPKIVKLWADVESSAIHTIETRKSTTLGFLKFHYDGHIFRIELPSGRSLFYIQPKMGVNRWGMKSIVFKGMDQVIKQWTSIETYGGKLVENIVQAISRDLLAYSMQALREEGFKMVMHVHDEVICEVKEEIQKEQLELMETIMGYEVPWAPGLPLVADGYTTKFYKKD